MKTLATFLPYILPYAMGCPKTEARRALVSAAIEFCEKTNVVRKTLDPMSTVANAAEYALDAPTTHEIVCLPTQVWFKGSELRPVASDNVRNPLAYRSSIPDVEAATGDPYEFFHTSAGYLGLYPTPTTSEADVLTVQAAMRPKRSATQLDDTLYDNWVEVLADGALARLLATAGQPFTDQAEANRRAFNFARAITRARIEGSRGRVRGELVVQMRPFA